MNRHIISVIVGLSLLAAGVHAQTQEGTYTFTSEISGGDEPLAGEWTGLYKIRYFEGDDIVEHDIKLVLRINKYGDSYRIRAKTIDVNNSSVTYREEAKVTFCDSRNISWVHNLGEDWDWSSKDRHNGRIVGHSSYKLICKASYKDGVLLYHDWICATYYDKLGNIIEEQSEADVYKGMQTIMTMYKEDNW